MIFFLGGVFGEPFNGSRNLSSVAEKDLFVARMNHSSGLISWMKRFGGAGDDSISALKSQGGLIYLAGGVKKTETKAYSFLFELDHNGIALKSSSFKGPNENQIVDLDVGGDEFISWGVLIPASSWLAKL